MFAPPIRIKLHFEGMLGRQLAEHGLDKCWYPLTSSQKERTVADLIQEMSPALDLVGDDSGLRFTLDGFTVLEDSPLSLFRDGDTVTIHSKTQHALPALEKRKKRKRLNLTSGMLGDAAEDAAEPPLKKKQVAQQAQCSSHAAADEEAPAAPATAQAKDTANGQPVNEKKKRKRQAEEQQKNDLDGYTPAAAARHDEHDEDEEKKPSRSARRKALKRKCRRLGLTPPQAPAASSAPAASVSPALAAAAAASPSDPNAGLDQPPNKKQKTQPFTVQPVISQPMKSHTAGDGHVYFAGSSSSESDSDSGACLQQLEQASGRADKPPTRWSQPNQALGKGKEDEAPSAAAAAAAAAKCQGMQGAELRKASELITSSWPKLPEEERCSCLLLPDTTADSLCWLHKKHTGNHSSTADTRLDVHKEQSQGDVPVKRKVQPQQASTAASAATAGLPDQATSSDLSLPKTDAENAALPAIEGMPRAGDIVAYKLLEIGPSWAPQVSEWRHGEVSFDEAGSLVISPLSEQTSPTTASAGADAANHEGDEEDEEEEEEEGPPTNYDEHGVLTTDLGSLSELRIIKASTEPLPLIGPAPAATPSAAARPIATVKNTEAAAADVNGTAKHSKESIARIAANGISRPAVVKEPLQSNDGLPCAAKASLVAHEAGTQGPVQAKSVPKIGAWAELEVQLQRRRVELAGQAATSKSAGPSSHHADILQQMKHPLGAAHNGNLQGPASVLVHATAQKPSVRGEAKQDAAHGASMGKDLAAPTSGARSVTESPDGEQSTGTAQPKGGPKPRAGVRASAMGPLLKFLRSSGGLDDGQ